MLLLTGEFEEGHAFLATKCSQDMQITILFMFLAAEVSYIYCLHGTRVDDMIISHIVSL